MSYAKCPYCDTEGKKENIIDTGHSNLQGMSRKGNTKNVYLCPECNEIFEARQKINDLVEPVDRYFNRSYL